MAAVVFSPKSRQDLLDIGDYIAKDSRANAQRFVAKLIEQCRRIGHTPLGYTGREDLAAGLRMAPLGRYLIFFRVIDGTVRIERGLHGARNLSAVLGGDREKSAGYLRHAAQTCRRISPFTAARRASFARPPSRQRRLFDARTLHMKVAYRYVNAKKPTGGRLFCIRRSCTAETFGF